ncbi:MAG: POT family MFS transporter [Proteobacteria bacterium]|nr:POT family MFS transporter [Pseudomonadota bacterium]
MSATAQMPKGIPYIIGNEAAERFSFYGMKTILMIFMTKYLLDSTGKNVFTEPEAMVWYHNFSSAVYFFPIVGALISDIFWGKYKTIMNLSIVYCLGHLVLSMFESRMGLMAGLTLISIGAGGIKPCVSAHVGDQFTVKNKDLISSVFSWFYFSINFGAFFSTLATPWLLQNYGSGVAFGVPGVLMLLATFVFWLGRDVFTTIPPVGAAHYVKELKSPAAKTALFNLAILYFFIAFFWSLYDQTGSSWVLQAEKMDRMVNLGFVQFEILSSQIQAVNPILIMLFVPLFNFLVYPIVGKFVDITPLRKIGVGFFLCVISFAITAFAEKLIEGGGQVSILWQVAAFAIITAAEVLVSVTALEFSYTQSPNSLKSLVMGLYLLSVTLGNQITSAVNIFIQDAEGKSTISGVDYYMFFTWLMLGASLIYMFYSRTYKGQTFVHSDSVASH